MVLSIEKKIGQLFFIGLSGTEINNEIKQLLEDISPGGICLFARNIRTAEQTRRLLDNLRELLPVEPLLSVDQEGGLVDRLRRIVTPMPSASSIESDENAKKLAEITAEVLLMLGFNMNFAPVIDVENKVSDSKGNGLYSRTFGSNKEVVAKLAAEYLGFLQKGGCLACLKHFPGLGSSQADSHEELPVVSLREKDLFDNDLFPYRELFKTNEIHAVMVAHATYPRLDLQETDVNGKLLPSSLSFNIINNLLRQDLGFEGLVISDDLEMGAILKNYPIGEACKMAIKAGTDMLSICADETAIRAGFEAVVKAVETGEIKESRIDESLKRIMSVKALTGQPFPLDLIRLQTLSQQIAELNKKVNYSYGG